MDVVIVVTPRIQQENFWRSRLAQGAVTRPGALIMVVTEDWEGGAGNGLGTLYAYQKAERQHGIDLGSKLRQGASIAMYHSSGRGMRLFPLAASEHNDKSAVELPVPVGSSCLTILEAVIKQTSLYADARKGRLSVFWGDQVFLPSKAAQRAKTHHADVLATIRPMPSRQEWEREGLSNYGLVAIAANGDAQLLEKQPYDQLIKLQKQGVIHTEGGVGTSLGSFSLSWQLLEAFLKEFDPELQSKKGKLDSDPHFWMPLTLDCETYLESLPNDTEARAHYDRMQRFKIHFLEQCPQLRLFHATDVGTRTYWWDYGSVRSYYTNSLKLAADGDEADMMRAFYELAPIPANNDIEEVSTDDRSMLYNCHIKSGKVKNSVLVNVTADFIDAVDSVLVNTTAKEIRATKALAYNVVEDRQLNLASNAVRADTFIAKGRQHIPMRTELTRDGKKDWEQIVCGNPLSYAELYNLNQNSDLIKDEKFESELRSQSKN